MPGPDRRKLSFAGSVSLGTGVMVGAGIFALVGQASELAGGRMPLAFIAGAVVVAFSAYSYVRYSDTSPSSGGIAMFMYVSMVVAESLLARRFGTYVTTQEKDLVDPKRNLSRSIMTASASAWCSICCSPSRGAV